MANKLLFTHKIPKVRVDKTATYYNIEMKNQSRDSLSELCMAIMLEALFQKFYKPKRQHRDDVIRDILKITDE